MTSPNISWRLVGAFAVTASGAVWLASGWRTSAPVEHGHPETVQSLEPNATQVTTQEPLLATGVRAAWGPAQRNPFLAAAVLPASVLPTSKPKMPERLVEAPPVQIQVPTAPPLNLVYLGRMTAPDGRQILFAKSEQTETELSVGKLLPNGYQVRVIRDSFVELEHLATHTLARLELPAAPRYETR